MKIALIFTYLHSTSGNVNVFLSLAIELQKLGNQVDVFTYYYDPEVCFPELANQLHIRYLKKVSTRGKNMSVTTLMSRVQAAVDYYIRTPNIFTLMKDSEYDLIFTGESCAYVPALKYKKIHNTPVVWSVFDPITLVDKAKPGSLVGKYPWFGKVLELHSNIDKKNIQKIDKVIVPTHKMKKELDAFYGIESLVFPTAGIHAEQYFTDHRELAKKRLVRDCNFAPKNNFIILAHAHFQPHRRYEDIIDAVALLSPARRAKVKLLISGNPNFDLPYYTSIEKKIKELDLEETIIIDPKYKSPEELVGYYQLSDVFVFVPIEQTWGLAPFEAMACQKPVILSTGAGCAEVVKNEHDALIVPAMNPQELATSLEKLIGSSKIRRQLGKNGYQLAVSHFNYPKIATQLTQLFKKLSA